MKAQFKPLETCAVIENVVVKIAEGKFYTAPYANITYYNSKAYVQVFVPGVVRLVSIPCQFGQTKFSEQNVRQLLAGEFVNVQISNGNCDVYFDIEIVYDGQDNRFTGGITFGHHR